ncbi:S24 family peptidase [Helicobacter typhlonius]|uniref:S24 family peptidase n=1 Tax=Helicobacter typhlonius TaxID=76936 RepID=UPI002FE0198A
MPQLTFREIIERIKDILATDSILKPKDIDVAKALNMSPNTLAQAKFKNSIPYKAIMDFLESKHICINTFFYGSAPKESVHTFEHYKILKLYSANASLGGGCINESIQSQEVIFDERILAHLKVRDCELILALGESMEHIITDRSLCLVNRKEGSIKNGKIYAVQTNDGLFIKHCFIKDKRLELISANLNYEPISYSLNEVEVIGRIRGVIAPV